MDREGSKGAKEEMKGLPTLAWGEGCPPFPQAVVEKWEEQSGSGLSPGPPRGRACTVSKVLEVGLGFILPVLLGFYFSFKVVSKQPCKFMRL